MALGSLPRRWVLQVLVGACHHALQSWWDRHRLCSLSWLQITQSGSENWTAPFLVFLAIPLCCCDRNLAANVRRSTLYFAEVQRIFFFNLMSFWSALGFYFRNRTNDNAAPLSCNVYCPVARAHWDWLLFQSGEAMAKGAYNYLMGSRKLDVLTPALPCLLPQAAF